MEIFSKIHLFLYKKKMIEDPCKMLAHPQLTTGYFSSYTTPI
jgi:hypothetical protein